MTPEGPWVQVTGASLSQGDYLPGCKVPVVPSDFSAETKQISIKGADLIIVTQSCDLDNSKVQFAATVAVSPVSKFEQFNPAFAAKGKWEEVRKNRIYGIYLLPSPTKPSDLQQHFVVDFRQIFSLPLVYLEQHAISLGSRWRLRSPSLEKFSQTFGLYFSRVAE